MSDSRRRAAKLAEELTAHMPMQLTLRPASVFQLTGLLQLVLRHPDLPTTSRRTAELQSS